MSISSKQETENKVHKLRFEHGIILKVCLYLVLGTLGIFYIGLPAVKASFKEPAYPRQLNPQPTASITALQRSATPTANAQTKSPQPTPTNTGTPKTATPGTQAPTKSTQPGPTNTEAPATVVPATPTPTNSPQPTPTAVVPTVSETGWVENPLGSHALAFGETLTLEVGGNKYAIQVAEVRPRIFFAGQSTNAPEGMKWIFVKLNLSSIAGGTPNDRVQFVHSTDFKVISNGQLDVGSLPINLGPSPRIDDIWLSFAEKSAGWMGFMVYQDDLAPILKLGFNGKEYFFSLAQYPSPLPVPDKNIHLAKDMGIGAMLKPVARGTGAFIESGGAIYRVSVQKVLRGSSAWAKMKTSFGFKTEPTAGMEYALAYIEVRAARAKDPLSQVNSALIGSSSMQKDAPGADKPMCAIPCFQSADLYPGGTEKGWVPMLVNMNDPAPLMVFDSATYFSLVDPIIPDPAKPVEPNPGAIGFANRAKLKQSQEINVTGPVFAFQFTRDDQFLISAGDDKLVHVWEVATGKEVQTLKGHQGSIHEVSLSPDGTILASLSPLGEIMIWDTNNWQLLQELRFKGVGLGVKLLDESTVLLIETNGRIKIWDLLTGKVVRELTFPRWTHPNCLNGFLQSFDASLDGSVLAASMQCGYGVVWNIENDKILFADSNNYRDIAKRSPNSSTISISSDGLMAVYGSVYYRNWNRNMVDMIDLKKKRVVGSVNPVDYDMYSSEVGLKNGMMLAGSSTSVWIWWPAEHSWNEKAILELKGHSARVTKIEISNRGEVLATGDYGGKIIIWKNS